MKELLVIIISIYFFSGCKPKEKEEIQNTNFLSGITDVQWKIKKLTLDAADKTADFQNYKFQFNTDYRVFAIFTLTGIVAHTSVWTTDPGSSTITISMYNANYPFTLLSGTWKVSNYTATLIEANQSVNGEQRLITFEKI